jgi:hypothetical protein
MTIEHLLHSSGQLANVVHVNDRSYCRATKENPAPTPIVSHYQAIHIKGDKPTHIFIKVPLDDEGEHLLTTEHTWHRRAYEAAPYGVMPLQDVTVANGAQPLSCVATELAEFDLRRHPDDLQDEKITHLLHAGYALLLMHKNQIVHRDVKPENLLITQHGARWTDFGSSCEIGENGPPRMHTPGFTAPECLDAYAERETKGYTNYRAHPAEDVYAFAETISQTLDFRHTPRTTMPGLKEAVFANQHTSAKERCLAYLLAELKTLAPPQKTMHAAG